MYEDLFREVKWKKTRNKGCLGSQEKKGASAYWLAAISQVLTQVFTPRTPFDSPNNPEKLILKALF